MVMHTCNITPEAGAGESKWFEASMDSIARLCLKNVINSIQKPANKIDKHTDQQMGGLGTSNEEPNSENGFASELLYSQERV